MTNEIEGFFFSNMHIAVLYTGELRTFNTVLPFFVKNVLLHENVHVFAVVQASQPSDQEQAEKTLREYMGNHLKDIEWFSKNDSTWEVIREVRLHEMAKKGVPSNFLEYLASSGSMIEHYQMYLAYQQMERLEIESGVIYDYIVRLRPDVVVCKPLDFTWVNNLKCTPRDTTAMNSLWRKLKEVHKNTCLRPSPSQKANSDSFILTFRKNVVYIVSRNNVKLMPRLGVTYGTLKYSWNHPDWWWNSETQFRNACMQAGLTIYDSSTMLEDQSLYDYDESRYFDSEGNLLPNLDAGFFIKRS